MFTAVVLLLIDISIVQEIEKLGHKNFYVRDLAFRKLGNMKEAPLRLLKIATNTSKDYEISERSRVLIDNFYSSIRPTNYIFTPWIDGLPQNYPNREFVIKKYLNDTGNYCNSGWCNYRQATQKLILELHNDGTPVSAIVELLNKMVEAEKQWCKEHKYCPFTLKYQFEMQEE